MLAVVWACETLELGALMLALAVGWACACMGCNCLDVS